MKKLFLSILLSSICFYTFAQADNKITIGTIDSIQSKILNEKRKIWVHVPNSDPNSLFSKERYPVVYLLDGDAHFSSVVGMIEQLSNVNGNTVFPKMIVVGIPNTDRSRDLTPIKDPISPSSGGGEQFLSFIEKELIPYIDSTYSTQPYKILIGHSLGGLAVMNSFINHTQLFNSYICIEPSLWWGGKQIFLKAAEKALSEKNFAGTTFYLGIANTLGNAMTLNNAIKDTTLATIHIRSILEFDKFVKSHQPKGLKYTSKYYQNDSHSSVPIIAEYDALHFIFDKYPFELSGKDYDDSTIDVAHNYALHYNEVSGQFGYTVKPPENEVNNMGYEFLQMKQYKKAEAFFNMNIRNYPESFNAYNAYGDYFVAIGNKAKAIENFKKALSIREYPECRQKLNKLLE